MPVVKPPLGRVAPGQPVTAQGWNQIVDGLSDVFDAVLALGTGTFVVRVTSEAQVVANARVVAVPTLGGQPVEAIAPFGDTDHHTLAGISDGKWRIHVLAPGFRPEVREVQIAGPGELAVPLQRAGVVVPALFGAPAQQALSDLAKVGLRVDLILDATGHEVSRATLPPTYQNSPVLLQLPDAGTVLDPSTAGVKLVLAAALQLEETVTMPSLVGLTYDEVVAALNQLGLKVGKTIIRSLPVRSTPDA
jgi:hypothetical protein